MVNKREVTLGKFEEQALYFMKQRYDGDQIGHWKDEPKGFWGPGIPSNTWGNHHPKRGHLQSPNPP